MQFAYYLLNSEGPWIESPLVKEAESEARTLMDMPVEAYPVEWPQELFQSMYTRISVYLLRSGGHLILPRAFRESDKLEYGLFLPEPKWTNNETDIRPCIEAFERCKPQLVLDMSNHLKKHRNHVHIG